MKSTQLERLKAHLERYGSITKLEALSELGILNGGARILELRQLGMPIDTQSEKVVTRNGTSVVARYVLKRPVFRPMTQMGMLDEQTQALRQA